MNAEQHPEELIDRARRGPLSPDEQAALDRHLTDCLACAHHLKLAARFERELAPQPRDEVFAQNAVAAAMARLQSSPRRNRQPRWLRLAAAGILLASGMTATAAIVRHRSSRPAAPVVEPIAAPASPLPAPRVAPVPEAPPAVEPTPPPDVPPPPPPRAAPPPAVTAGALFERAGKLRREGRADAAIATYRRLQDGFPEAREAQLSFALAGQLLLDRGRPAEALAQFDRRSRLGGDVGEESLAGRATALEQLHRNADAITAWKSLLERYPRSIYAARARARLAQLGEHP